jgi:hypothetical protein
MGSLNGVPVELILAWAIWVGGGVGLMLWFKRASAAQTQPPVPAHGAGSQVRQSSVRDSTAPHSGVLQSGVRRPGETQLDVGQSAGWPTGGVQSAVQPSGVQQSNVGQSGVREPGVGLGGSQTHLRPNRTDGQP